MRIKSSLELILSISLVAMFGSQALASTAVFTWKDHDLEIGASTPPALIYITDSQNNMSGADPSKPLNQYGQGTIIQKIPGSYVEQESLESDDVNGVFIPNSSSSWSINLPDHGPETITVHLQGLSTGAFQLWVAGLYAFKSGIPKTRSDLKILISKGQSKSIKIYFDASSRSLTTTTVLNSGDFLKDTQAACNQNAISPLEACEALDTLAEEVEKAKTKGDPGAEASGLEVYLAILDRLHNWNKNGLRRDWGDFTAYTECKPLCNKDFEGVKVFAKDPSYSALKLDAETLLNALQKNGGDKEGQSEGRK